MDLHQDGQREVAVEEAMDGNPLDPVGQRVVGNIFTADEFL